MSCLYPVKMFRLHARNPETGKNILVHNENSIKGRDVVSEQYRSCGYCTECRLEKSRQTAMRCVHQASLSDYNSFITLTYDDDHLPKDLSLSTHVLQCFWKRLRKRGLPPIKYFAAGEYGDGNGIRSINPHYHACVFGFDFPDRKYHTTQNGHRLYTSALLTDVWGFGHCLIGDVTFESAAYVARYTMKKVYGKDAPEYYSGRLPEQSWSSLGLAKEWLERYKDDVYPSDECIVRGRKCRPPRYYDRILSQIDPVLFSDVEFDRAQKINISKNNFTSVFDPVTLTHRSVSEIVKRAQISTSKLDCRR